MANFLRKVSRTPPLSWRQFPARAFRRALRFLYSSFPVCRSVPSLRTNVSRDRPSGLTMRVFLLNRLFPIPCCRPDAATDATGSDGGFNTTRWCLILSSLGHDSEAKTGKALAQICRISSLGSRHHYLPTAEDWLYLACELDLCSRRVIPP